MVRGIVSFSIEVRELAEVAVLLFKNFICVLMEATCGYVLNDSVAIDLLPARGSESAARINDTRPYSGLISLIEFSNSAFFPNKLSFEGLIERLYKT